MNPTSLSSQAKADEEDLARRDAEGLLGPARLHNSIELNSAATIFVDPGFLMISSMSISLKRL